MPSPHPGLQRRCPVAVSVQIPERDCVGVARSLDAWSFRKASIPIVEINLDCLGSPGRIGKRDIGGAIAIEIGRRDAEGIAIRS